MLFSFLFLRQSITKQCWPGTHNIDKGGLELRVLLDSQVWGLKVCITLPSPSGSGCGCNVTKLFQVPVLTTSSQWAVCNLELGVKKCFLPKVAFISVLHHSNRKWNQDRELHIWSIVQENIKFPRVQNLSNDLPTSSSLAFCPCGMVILGELAEDLGSTLYSHKFQWHCSYKISLSPSSLRYHWVFLLCYLGPFSKTEDFSSLVTNGELWEHNNTKSNSQLKM